MLLDSRRLINHQGYKYVILRIIRDEHKPIIDSWTKFLGADIALRNNGLIHFCQQIHEPDELVYESMTCTEIKDSDTCVENKDSDACVENKDSDSIGDVN